MSKCVDEVLVINNFTQDWSKSIMKIIMTHESTINAIGKQRNANRKEVFCITDGKIYTSCIDAAEAIGVTRAAISRHVTGIVHTCMGKKFCYAKDVAEHLEEISESMQKRQRMYENAVTESAKTYAENAELRAENERLRNENAELQICVDSAQGNLDWHADVVAKCHEEMSHMEQLIENLRQELAEYKEREAKRERIKALRAELADLEKEES